MNNEETIYNQTEEETLNAEEQGMAVDAAKEDTPVPCDGPEAGKKKKKNLETYEVAAAAGLAGVAVGMLIPVDVFPDPEEVIKEEEQEQEEIPEQKPAPEPQPSLVGHDMPVASGVEDSMSFSQAFAAARREVGPGGIFAWRGHCYGTYYATEWNAMSDEEHDQYWADVYHTTPQIDYEPTTNMAEEPTAEPVPESTDDVPVLGLREGDIYAVVDTDGDDRPDMAVVDANGNEIPDVILDSTGKGKFDTLILDPEVDEEGNVIVDEDKVLDIDGVQLLPDEPCEIAEEPADDVLLVSNGEEGETPETEIAADPLADDVTDAADDLLV